MTSVEITRKHGSVVSLIADGHTGYGVEGEDIVCAALSSIIQTALLGLMRVVGIEVKYSVDDEKGFLEFELPELDSVLRHDADVILDTMQLGISDLYETYSDFIELKLNSL